MVIPNRKKSISKMISRNVTISKYPRVFKRVAINVQFNSSKKWCFPTNKSKILLLQRLMSNHHNILVKCLNLVDDVPQVLM